MKAGNVFCPLCGAGFHGAASDVELLGLRLEGDGFNESRIHGRCMTGHRLTVRMTPGRFDVVAEPLEGHRDCPDSPCPGHFPFCEALECE